MRGKVLRRACVLAACVVAVGGWSQWEEVESLEVPMSVEASSIRLLSVRESNQLAERAQRALGSGLYDLAYSLGKQALERNPEGRVALDTEFLVVDALLATTQWVEAKARLVEIRATEGASLDRVELREAMLEYAESDVAAVTERLGRVADSRLSVGERAWAAFLRGWMALKRGDEDASGRFFASAREAAGATSPALLAQIHYLVFRSLLESGTAAAATVPQLQNALLENAGREIRFVYAQQLAALRHDAGEVEAAIELIEESLLELPIELRRMRAQFLLLQTMAAGLERVEGRQALATLLEGNAYPDLMSIALQQSFSDARLEGGSGEEVIRARLDQIIERGTEHLLLDQALYYRAVFRFLDGAFVESEEDAEELQRLFPNSPYRRGMLALQASSAWNRERYRTAANRLQTLRSEFADLEADYRLSALIADCYFRAGRTSGLQQDYRNAADAYATALANVLTEDEAGPLFFQLVLAHLRAGQLDRALEVVDDRELQKLAGAEMVWRAKWIALEELRSVDVAEAYERSQQALLSGIDDPLLKLRLLWLTARLSFVSGDPEYTVEWVREIEDFVESEPLVGEDEDLKNKVLASSLLSLSESYFVLGEPEEAIALLERLRADYPGYESALLSYIAHARYLSSQNRTVEAQQLLVSLADKYKEHRLAPSALLEAARNAVRRGQDAYLDEATKLLQRIATDYPNSDIVFQARLMQADLLRRLNKFGSAERIYFLLENEYADHEYRFFAQMSMADTLLAQANEDKSKFDGVVSRLELLTDLPEAPLNLRVEAGYKLGQAWRSRGEVVKAKLVFWQLYDRMFFGDERAGEAAGGGSLLIRELDAKGRYWISRCLFSLAEITKEEGRVDQANAFYQAVIDHQLNGVELAKRQLEIQGLEQGALGGN